MVDSGFNIYRWLLPFLVQLNLVQQWTFCWWGFWKSQASYLLAPPKFLCPSTGVRWNTHLYIFAQKKSTMTDLKNKSYLKLSCISEKISANSWLTSSLTWASVSAFSARSLFSWSCSCLNSAACFYRKKHNTSTDDSITNFKFLYIYFKYFSM